MYLCPAGEAARHASIKLGFAKPRGDITKTVYTFGNKSYEVTKPLGVTAPLSSPVSLVAYLFV